MVWLGGLAGVGGLTLLTYWLLPLNNGPWLPNAVFAPVTWSTDNQLSVMMAKSLLQRGPGPIDFLGPWSVTDRGVAPAGMLSGLFLLLRLVGGFDDNQYLWAISHLFQVVLQGCIVPALLLILRDDGWNNRRLWWMTMCLALSPFVFFNSFYVWPKLLPGMLGILGALLGARWLRAHDMRALALSILCLAAGPLLHSAALLAMPAAARVPGVHVAGACAHCRLASGRARTRERGCGSSFLRCGVDGAMGAGFTGRADQLWRDISVDRYWHFRARPVGNHGRSATVLCGNRLGGLVIAEVAARFRRWRGRLILISVLSVPVAPVWHVCGWRSSPP